MPNDDRDKQPPKHSRIDTSPKGVAIQRLHTRAGAPPPVHDPAAPSWEQPDLKSGVHDAAPDSALDLIRRRAGATLDATKESLKTGANILERVSGVETEIVGLKTHVDAKIGGVESRMTGLEAVNAKQSTQLELILKYTTPPDKAAVKEIVRSEIDASTLVTDRTVITHRETRRTEISKAVVAGIFSLIVALVAGGYLAGRGCVSSPQTTPLKEH
jgi:hypothetical protein